MNRLGDPEEFKAAVARIKATSHKDPLTFPFLVQKREPGYDYSDDTPDNCWDNPKREHI